MDMDKEMDKNHNDVEYDVYRRVETNGLPHWVNVNKPEDICCEEAMV